MRDGPLRVGVIGLGRLWDARHKPALLRMTDRFRVVAVYDQVARRAEIEAEQLRCEPANGLRVMIERPDIDAFYLLTPQWFGLHPVEIACQARKPVYCASSLTGRPDELERIGAMVRQAGIPFMPELARRFYPATLRLRELLATTLGPPRLIVGHTRLSGYDRYSPPGPASQLLPAPLAVDPGGNILDWCRFVFGNLPITIQAFGAEVFRENPDGSGTGALPGDDYEAFVVGFPDGAVAEMSLARYHRDVWGDAHQFLPTPGFQVFAERGVAWLEMPDQIRWSDSSGLHQEKLPLEPSVGEVLNAHFHRLVRGEPNLAPTIDDALAMTRLVSLGRQSRAEARLIPTDSVPSP
jgi:predicted dehydrogenase